MKKGFTLLELLVVVLIIGILSSVAIPQYNKAVRRSRATEAWQVGKTLLDAEHMYFLENREYTDSISQLRVRYPLRDEGGEGESVVFKNFELYKKEISTDTEGTPFVAVLNGTGTMSDVRFVFMITGDGKREVACTLSGASGEDALKECISFLPCSPTAITDMASVPGTGVAGKKCSL